MSIKLLNVSGIYESFSVVIQVWDLLMQKDKNITSTLCQRKGGAPQPSITFSCQARGCQPGRGGVSQRWGVLHTNDNDNDDADVTPKGRFNLQSRSTKKRKTGSTGGWAGLSKKLHPSFFRENLFFSFSALAPVRACSIEKLGRWQKKNTNNSGDARGKKERCSTSCVFVNLNQILLVWNVVISKHCPIQENDKNLFNSAL